jgi:prepilin-type N-terminal cleavage/methylation domain-containing protein
MKEMNKKGFTIVELVIVIAVIAILAGVLIPTFASIVKKANDSAMLQEVSAAKTILLAEENGQLDSAARYIILYLDGDNTVWFELKDGEINKLTDTNRPPKVDGKFVADANDVILASSAGVLAGQSALSYDSEGAAADEITTLTYNDDLNASVLIWKVVPNV